MFILNLFFCILLFIAGFYLKKIYAGYSKYDHKILNWLYIYHVAIGIVFYYYVMAYGGDATVYWDKAKQFSFSDIITMISNGSATGFILLVNYVPAQVLKLSFFSGSFIYIILGYWGVLLFYNIIKEILPHYTYISKYKLLFIPIFPGLLFLPNLHFWTSGLGKDTILFFCVALFMHSIINMKKRFIGLLASMALGFFIRPHIVLFLMISFGIATLFDAKMKSYQKILIIAVFASLAYYLFSYVMNFVKLESLDTQTIEAYSANKTKVLSSSSGSGIDLSSYSYPAKVFTFLYRPLFFDINGLLAVVSSFENLMLLIFSIKIIFNNSISTFKASNRAIKSLLFFFLIGALTFSLILGNLGIMLRQKVPFIFALIVFGYTTFSYELSLKRRAFLQRKKMQEGLNK